MLCIKSIATALPEHCCDTSAMEWAGEEWLAGRPEKELFLRFVRAARGSKRFFIRPVAEVLEYKGQRSRAELFEEEGSRLGSVSASRAIYSAGVDPGTISSFVFTSCSCPVIPSIDAKIAENIGLLPNIYRLPIFQFGCAGGVQGLALASRLAGKGSGDVLFTSVEICSLIYHKDDTSPAQLVGSAIFGDASASLVLGEAERGLEYIASSSCLIPGTRHLIGYNLHDDGLHLRLDKNLPDFLASVVKKIVQEFLAAQGLDLKDVASWLFHPGGKKIIEQIEKAFSLKEEQSYWSRRVLHEVGNVSSSTVLFVIKDYLDSRDYKKDDYILLLGIGPGLTLESVLLRNRM